MILGLLSDVHGNAPALRAALDFLGDRVDCFLFAGDCAGYYPFVNECIGMFPMEKFFGVRGNHDEFLLQCIETGTLPADYQKKYGSALIRSLASLTDRSKNVLIEMPRQQEIVLEGSRIALFHGSPWDPLNGRVYPDFSDWQQFDGLSFDYLILGHTHYAMEKRFGDLTIINPGSVGQPRDGKKGACFAELDTARGQVRFYTVPYNSRQVIEDARINDPENSYLVQVLQ